MNSDTVIGIVGAVVLVSVMVGVFAYEYNNVAEEMEPDMEVEKMNTFNATYPTLFAMGDMDMDGVPNYNDTDMDGDGINNTVDDEIKTHHDLSGSLAQGASSESVMFMIPAEQGIRHVMVHLEHAALVSGQTTGALEVTLTTPDGFETTLSPVAEGGLITYDYELTLDLLAGDYIVTVAHPSQGGVLQVGQAVDFTGDLALHY